MKLVFNPNGPDCRHVYITDDAGAILEVSHEDALMQPLDKRDSDIVQQVKLTVLKQGIKDIKTLKGTF